MDSKVTSIVSYLTWIGFVVSLVCGTKDENSLKHINQSFVICVVGTAGAILGAVFGMIPGVRVVSGIIFAVVGVAVFVCFLIGIISAATDKEFNIPVVSDVKIFK